MCLCLCLHTQMQRGIFQRLHLSHSEVDDRLGRSLVGILFSHQSNLIADVLKPSGQLPRGTLRMTSVKVIAAALAILRALFGEDVPGNDENAMGNRNGGLLQPARSTR